MNPTLYIISRLQSSCYRSVSHRTNRTFAQYLRVYLRQVERVDLQHEIHRTMADLLKDACLTLREHFFRFLGRGGF